MERTVYIMSVTLGLIFIFLLAIVSSLVFSLILQFSTVQQSSLQIAITIASFFTLFIGGLVAGNKGKEKGWLLGALTGISYTLIIFLFQYLGYDKLFSLNQIIYHAGYITVAICGGIVGVNMLKSNPKSF